MRHAQTGYGYAHNAHSPHTLGPLQLLGQQETVRFNESWQLIPNVKLDANSKMQEEAVHRAIAPHIPARASR